jgi:MFS family permease
MVSSYFRLHKNIYLLSIGQVIGMSATTMVVLIGGLIGTEIAPSPTLATLPTTMMFIGLALTTIPAALLMKKIGRKKGFILSSLSASLATFLASFAVYSHNFTLFCASAILLGSNGAFMQQFRFAALESVNKEQAGKAVSMILFAGIIAGFLGPEIAKRSKNLFMLPEYTGSFMVMALLFIIVAAFMGFIKDVKIHEEKKVGRNRPLSEIMLKPLFLLALLGAGIGFGVMISIMTATPIHLHKIAHFSLEETTFVIQSHIIAMFLPSLITGVLVLRFGVFKVLFTGLVSFLVTIFLGTFFHSLISYWLGLILLGIGWNFLFISSTILLSQSYQPSERFKTQGVNDFIVVIVQMLSSFLAGSLLFTTGWINLNLLVLPFIVITLVVFIYYRQKFAVLQK